MNPNRTADPRPNPEMDLTGARQAGAGTKAGAVASHKEQLCLCGGRGVARRSFPSR